MQHILFQQDEKYKKYSSRSLVSLNILAKFKSFGRNQIKSFNPQIFCTLFRITPYIREEDDRGLLFTFRIRNQVKTNQNNLLGHLVHQLETAQRS